MPYFYRERKRDDLSFFSRNINIFSPIPNLDSSCPILTFGYPAFEISVIKGMILGHDCQPFIGGIKGKAFWHCPAFEDTIKLHAKIIMKPPGIMFLNDINGLIA